MSTKTPTSSQISPLVIVGSGNGISLIPQPTVLTRLNYFDGKFLRAEHLKAEQQYLRRLVQLSNQAGGWGVAYGFDLTLGKTSDTLELSAGLAIDPSGSVLLLPVGTTISIDDLIERSKQRVAANKSSIETRSTFGDCEVVVSTSSEPTVLSSDIYVITIFHAEALCGTEDVFGKLCEEACVTSSDRPYLIEGILVRAVPIALSLPPAPNAVALGSKHFRSQVASAYFAAERERVRSLISGAGLRGETWCLGADADPACGVPIGILARSQHDTLFFDAWTARRERIDTTAKRYWQWRMAMRPWDVYLAQILQFQCQLHELLHGGVDVTGPGPCGGAGSVIREANEAINEVTLFHRAVSAQFASLNILERDIPTLAGGLTRFADLSTRLRKVDLALSTSGSKQALIDGGIVELPSAGYLPVSNLPESLTVNEQVRNFMGEGVDLRFCVVRPDFVPHALEEAQHMDRISLLEGLGNPNKPEVDILVPNGVLIGQQGATATNAYEATAAIGPWLDKLSEASSASTPIALFPSSAASLQLTGAARMDMPERGPVEMYAAVNASLPKLLSLTVNSHMNILLSESGVSAANVAFENRNIRADGNTAVRVLPALWLGLHLERNPLAGDPVGQTPVDVRILTDNASLIGVPNLRLNGTLQYQRRLEGTDLVLEGKISDGLLVTPVSHGPAVVKIRAILSPRTDTQPARLRIDLGWSDGGVADIRRISFTFQQQNAQEISLTVAESFGNEAASQFRMGFRLNPNVVQGDNEFHSMALDAISTIGASISEEGFVERASDQLFPHLAPPTPEAIVRATTDWVLFHRRRKKQCSIEAPEVVKPLPKSYRVAHLRIPVSADGATVQVGDIRTALATNDHAFFEQRQLLFGPIDVVEFRAGVPGLATDSHTFHDDWDNVLHGPQITHAAIANNPAGEAESPSLAVARLQVLVDSLRREGVFSGVSLTVGPELLEIVPSVLNASGVDGAIALVSLQVLTRPFTFVASAAPLIIQRGANQPVGEIDLRGIGGESGRTIFLDVVVKFSAPVSNQATNAPRLVVDSPTVESIGERIPGTPDAYVFRSVPLLMGDATERLWRIKNVFVDSSGGQGTTGGAATVTADIAIHHPSDQPVTVEPTNLLVAIIREAKLRTVRIAVVSDTTHGGRVLRPDLKLAVATIGEDGALPATGLPPGVVDDLRRAGPFGIFEMDVVVGSVDNNANRRSNALFAALIKFSILTPAPRRDPTRMLPGPDAALASEGSMNFDDIVFLQRG